MMQLLAVLVVAAGLFTFFVLVALILEADERRIRRDAIDAVSDYAAWKIKHGNRR